MAGGICGALVGSVTALLLTPASGEELKSDIVARFETARNEAEMAKIVKRGELEAEFANMKKGK